MKKQIKIGIVCFILGLIFCGIVNAAVSLSSDKVGYNNTTVDVALDNLFDESVNGKTKIAEAITNKGIETLNTDSYDTIVSNINNISTGNPNLRYDEESGYIQAIDTEGNWINVYPTSKLPMAFEIKITSDFTGSTYYSNANGYRTVQNQKFIGDYSSFFTLSSNMTMTFLRDCKIDISVSLDSFSADTSGWIGYVYGKNISDVVQSELDSSTGTDAATRIIFGTSADSKSVSINVEAGYKLRFVWKMMHKLHGIAASGYTAHEQLNVTITSL